MNIPAAAALQAAKILRSEERAWWPRNWGPGHEFFVDSTSELANALQTLGWGDDEDCYYAQRTFSVDDVRYRGDHLYLSCALVVTLAGFDGVDDNNMTAMQVAERLER